jgi:hypothetical protein
LILDRTITGTLSSNCPCRPFSVGFRRYSPDMKFSGPVSPPEPRDSGSTRSAWRLRLRTSSTWDYHAFTMWARLPPPCAKFQVWQAHPARGSSRTGTCRPAYVCQHVGRWPSIASILCADRHLANDPRLHLVNPRRHQTRNAGPFSQCERDSNPRHPRRVLYQLSYHTYPRTTRSLCLSKELPSQVSPLRWSSAWP